MAALGSWPTVNVGVAFTAGTFSETTAGNLIGGAESFTFTRGRQYELGRTQTGQGNVTFDNRDNRYTPKNSSSPTPVGLYNELLVTATWAGTTYPVMRGFVERWPVGFASDAPVPTSNVATVDAGGILANQILRSVADSVVLLDSPVWFYKLDEASGASGAGDSASPGKNPIGIVRTSAAYGGTPASFGGATGLADSSTGLVFPTQPSIGTSTVPLPLTYLDLGTPGRPIPLLPLSTVSDWSIEMWITVTAPNTTGVYTLAEITGTGASNYINRFNLFIDTAGLVNVTVAGYPGSLTSAAQVSSTVRDGKLHHIVATLAGGITLTLFVDGVQVATTVSTGISGSLDLLTQRYHTVGCNNDSFNGMRTQFYGTIARYAGYGTSLTPAKVLEHYQSGSTAFNGEDSGARIARLLRYAGWPTALTDVSAGAAALGPALVVGSTVLQAIQNVADDELGNLWFSAAGKVTFRPRTTRYTMTTSTLTFGELESSGELPYNDTAVFDYDPTFVITSQKVSRAGGITTTAYASNPQPLPYPKAGADRKIGLLSDGEVVDQATWLVAQYSQARVRVVSLSIFPSGNANLWPAALGTEIGTRVTVKRRTVGQPVMSIDCFIESVTHRVTADSWETTFLMSPVDSPHAMLWDTDNWDDTNVGWTV